MAIVAPLRRCGTELGLQAASLTLPSSSPACIMRSDWGALLSSHLMEALVDTPAETPRSRRAILMSALGAGAGAIAAALSRPSAVKAVDGDQVVVGGEYVGSSVTL